MREAGGGEMGREGGGFGGCGGDEEGEGFVFADCVRSGLER